MDFSTTGIVRMMDTKMNYHAERQDVLSQNIANADTPGYRPKDLGALDFGSMLPTKGRLRMAQTTEGHKSGISLGSMTNEAQETRKNFEIKPVKNAVNLEEQMTNVSHNAFAYQMTTTLYKKSADLFRLAVQNR
jgi:flagellar basal-body rod protein FlgB